MAKLTRTSKFADLRGQISNDRESGVVTNDLSSYQNRLNSVQGQLDPRMQEQMNNTQSFNNSYHQQAYNQQPQYTTAQFEQPQQPQMPQYTAAQFEQPQQNFNNLNMNNNSNNDYYNNYQQQASNNNINKTLTIDDIYNDVFSSMNQGQNSVNNNNINNDYMEQTFSGVNSYNMNNGQQTLNDILDSNVDAVRHQQPQQSYQYQQQQQPVNQQQYNTNNMYQSNPQSDREFSNTVSLEISKIMDGIDNNGGQNVKPQQPQQPQQLHQKPQQQQDSVVEIKNIRDTEPVTRDTMSETIPFVVSDQETDEYDEEGSNTVLNIILIVLIIILIAVLGMIVFYILKTKGIL